MLDRIYASEFRETVVVTHFPFQQCPQVSTASITVLCLYALVINSYHPLQAV